MISYWETAELLGADLTIVGGGITGLSIAASLLERSPNLHVRVLERSVLPYGASTRNAGFACFGSPTELASDIALMGKDEARELVFQRWMGIQITRKRLKDDAIGYIPSGGYELLMDGAANDLDLEGMNALVADFLPDYFSFCTDRKSEMGLQAAGELVSIKGEGQVNSGRLMQSLRSYVTSMGAEVINGAEVVEIEEEAQGYGLIVNDAHRGKFTLSTARVVIANNAFASELLDDKRIQPGRGQVLITKPLADLKFKGNLHIEEGFYYLRDLGGRLMFGGGRNLDKDGEATHDQALNPSIQNALDSYLIKLFGEDAHIEVEQRWSGTMAFTANKQPILEESKPGLWLVAGLSGMGIALAGYLGEEMADQLLGKE